MASQKHRDALLEVPLNTTLEQVLTIMSVTTYESTIIFTTKDLPSEGADHNKALQWH